MNTRASRQPTSVSIGFVAGILAGMARHGRDPAVLLDLAGIATQSLHDPAARVPVARYAALYRLIIDQLDDEGFGLFSRPLRRGTFEFLCRGVLSAADLDEALDRIARFLRIVLDDFDVAVRHDDDAALLTIAERRVLQVDATGRIFSYEWLLRMIHGLAAWLVAKPLTLDEAAFPYDPPPHAAEYEFVFAPRCRFGAPSLAARFAAADLAAPVRRDEAALKAFLADAPASITTLYRRDRALALRVREHLRAALPEAPTLPQLARRLFVSPRTLHRRLEDEGTSLRAIRAGLQRDLAVDWLTKTDRLVSRIAADLGFADASAFYRAFAAWTGEGPRRYRQQAGR